MMLEDLADDATPSQRFAALERCVQNRARVLEMLRNWHAGAASGPMSCVSIAAAGGGGGEQQQQQQASDKGDHSSVPSASSPTPPPSPPRMTRTTRLSSLFFGTLHIGREQLSEYFAAAPERTELVARMYSYGMGVGALLVDHAMSASTAADFVFHLFELHLEVQLDETATDTLPASRMMLARALRKDRAERLGDAAAADMRPQPRHLDREGRQPPRFAAESFLLHAAHEPDARVAAADLDYFAVCVGFLQTTLLCYRRVLDTELARNAMAMRRLAQWDRELELTVVKPLFVELRGLVDALLGQADADLMAALACA